MNASGYVTARREATVSSKVTGKVIEVLVEEGMKVEQGQVLARIDSLPQDGPVRMMFDNRVMPGRDVIATEGLSFAPQVPELQLLVAHHARVWGPAGLVFTRKIIDHEALELVGFVHDVMGKA